MPISMVRGGVLGVIAVAVVLLSLSGVEAAPFCDAGTGHCYQFSGDPDLGIVLPRTWGEAKTKAEELGGHLVTITSFGENALLLVRFPGAVQTDPWIGLFQTGGPENEPAAGWTWVNGEGPVGPFVNWGSGEPNQFANTEEDFAHLSAGAVWNDNIDGLHTFLIEYEPAPTNGTVPEPGTLMLLSTGLLAAWGWKRRRK